MADTIIERKDGLVTLTFDRAERKNAINAEIWSDLDRVLAEVTRNPEDRALLIRGAGDNFSSGADLGGGLRTDGEPKGLTGGPPQAILHEMRIVGDLINRLHHLPKPTLAVVDGVAAGVALGLVLACDLAIATDRARFCEIFVKRGLALDGGTSWSLPRVIGLRRAKQMAFFGDMLSAQEALDFGLVNEVVAPGELDALADQWGQRLAKAPTTAIGMIKRLLDSSTSHTFEQATEEEARCQHISFTTEDMHEGMRAFMERRDPEFTGR
ncbi:MAG: enoyl-CoA hydratase-related protein [bacterium]|nr:enoyl-CoA hydratase-related protein [bacterium]